MIYLPHRVSGGIVESACATCGSTRLVRSCAFDRMIDEEIKNRSNDPQLPDIGIRSGIACCGADYPFGPSGSFRDIVCRCRSFGLRAEHPGSVSPYPMRCAARMSSGRLPIRRGVPFAAVLERRTSGKRLSVSHALCCPRVVCGMFLPTLHRLSGQYWGPFFRGRR